MWSCPMIRYDSSDMDHYFSECEDCNFENVHFCKHDDVPSHIQEFADIILKYDINENNMKKCPILTDVYHNEADIIKAIEKIPAKAACGPDG